MAENVTSTAQNDFATARVQPDQKKSLFSVSMVSAGFCICMSGLFTGASMAAGLGIWQAVIAALVGNLILFLYGGLLGAAGAKEGVATSMLARHSFGRQGSKIISLVLALTMLGWFSVQIGFFGNTINAMFPNGGFFTSVPAAAAWGGILMMLTAYFGYKGLNVLSLIAVPLIFITALIGIFAAVGHAGGWDKIASIVPTGTIDLGTGIVLAVGSFAGGASAQADITRYSKSPLGSWIATFIGYMIANVFIILAGFITTLATGIGDLPSAMLGLGLGIPAMIVLVLAQWTTNDNNLYTSSLGFSNIINVPKKRITLVAGIIATIVGAAGLSNYFTSWLIILGVGIPPMAGIIIADYYILKKRSYMFGEGTQYSSWNLLAFISWLIAALAGYFITWGIASVNSLVIGFAVYLVLMKTLGVNKTAILGAKIENN
jgi:cytosine permease